MEPFKQSGSQWTTGQQCISEYVVLFPGLLRETSGVLREKAIFGATDQQYMHMPPDKSNVKSRRRLRRRLSEAKTRQP